MLRAPPGILVEAVGHALSVARQTAGLVTPAVLTALEVAGYAQPPGERLGTTSTVLDTSEVVCTPEMIRPTGRSAARSGRDGKVLDRRTRVYPDIARRQLYRCGRRPDHPAVRAFAVEIVHPFGGAPLYLECPARHLGRRHLQHTETGVARAAITLSTPARPGRSVSELFRSRRLPHCLTDAEVLTKLAFLEHCKLDALQGQAQVYAFDRAGQFWTRSGKVWQKME